MTEVKNKTAPKAKKAGNSADLELLKELQEKLGYLWNTMQEHAEVITTIRNDVDKIKGRMGI
jgi:hypothetical protein